MSSLLLEMQKDDVYAPFLSDSFDPQAHASHLAQGAVIADHLSKLNAALTKLEKEIEIQVGSHYEDLLSQASGVETLEDVLNTMHGRIQTLQVGVERLRARIVEPYNQIAQQTLILGRLQSACELLRRIIRSLSLSQRLKEQLANGPKDITKAALSLKELDDIGKTMDLSGIDILEKDQRFIRQTRSDIEKQATIMMDKGMELHNQSQIGTALQVFHNLGTLYPSVEKVLDQLIKRLSKSIASALDVNSISQTTKSGKKVGSGSVQSNRPTIGQSAQFRASLWTGLEKLMDDIYDICIKTCYLHKVLARKKDPSTHLCFLDELYRHNRLDLFTRLWKRVTNILTEEFAKASAGSNFIRQALEVDYPKLLRLYGDLWKKLEGVTGEIRTTVSSHSDLSELSSTYDKERSENEAEKEVFDPEVALKNSLAPLEKAYLSRSLSRLFDAVNLMFSTPGTVPSKEEIDSLIKNITSELNVSAVDSDLSGTIAKNVVKTIHLFCQKCDQLVVCDGESTQVISPPTPSQKLNVEVVNQLTYVYNQVSRVANATLAHLPQPVVQNLLNTLPSIEKRISSSVEPLFSSLRASTEAIILTMHKEDFSSNDIPTDPEVPCSLYMKELQNFLNRATTDYIEPFSQSLVIKKQIHSLCCFVLELFVRHISLLRPIGEQGKMRIATDFAQMELAISPMVARPSDLGKPYRILRSFRPLLFQTPEHIASSSAIGDMMPHSTVLHYLFSKAPPEMRSPHQTAGWSQTRYSSWLDDHPSERERLLLVKGALEAYVTTVKSKHLTQFDPLYPILRELLQQGWNYLENGSKNRGTGDGAKDL